MGRSSRWSRRSTRTRTHLELRQSRSLQIAKGDREAAEDAFRRAVTAAPQSLQAHGSLGQLSLGRWEARRSRDGVQGRAGIDPTSSAVNRAMAAFYSARTRGEAEPYLKTYAQGSGTTEAKLLLADYYVRARQESRGDQHPVESGGGRRTGSRGRRSASPRWISSPVVVRRPTRDSTRSCSVSRGTRPRSRQRLGSC